MFGDDENWYYNAYHDLEKKNKKLLKEIDKLKKLNIIHDERNTNLEEQVIELQKKLEVLK